VVAKKHDWELLFRDYLMSPHVSAKTFLREEKGFFQNGSNSFAQNKIRDWDKRKEEIKQAETSRLARKVEIETGLSTEKLLKLKWDCITLLNNKLAKDKDNMPVSEIERIIRIIKTELYEPCVITQGKMETKLDATDKFKEVVINFIDAD